MGTLREQAEKLGIEVDGRWSNANLKRKIIQREFDIELETARETVPKDNKLTSVRLVKHYKPIGWYRLVGHYDAENKFVSGEQAPSPESGVSFDHKFWADTVLELPSAEARKLVENVVVNTHTIRDEKTKQITGSREVSTLKPLASVFTDWSFLDKAEENAAA